LVARVHKPNAKLSAIPLKDLVQRVETSDFYVKLFVKSKNDSCECLLVRVYGEAQEVLKPDFLAELVRICESETLPMLVGGDFNIIRRKEEKIMIISMLDGLLLLMPSLRVLIYERSFFLVGSLRGLVGEIFPPMRSDTSQTYL
jgi:hypothetical protein